MAKEALFESSLLLIVELGALLGTLTNVLVLPELACFFPDIYSMPSNNLGWSADVSDTQINKMVILRAFAFSYNRSRGKEAS